MTVSMKETAPCLSHLLKMLFSKKEKIFMIVEEIMEVDVVKQVDENLENNQVEGSCRADGL